MKSRLIAVALAGAVLASSFVVNADARRDDGNYLLEQCQSFIKLVDSERDYIAVNAGACGGFVQGVSDTIYFLGDELPKEAKFCEPNGTTNTQLVRIVVKYLKDNPKLLNTSKTSLVWSALQDAYPCK